MPRALFLSKTRTVDSCRIYVCEERRRCTDHLRNNGKSSPQDLAMDSFLSELFGKCRLEYVVLDSQFRITRMSKDAAQFADTPEAAVKGADVRDAFPEIVGAESKLQVVARRNLPNGKCEASRVEQLLSLYNRSLGSPQHSSSHRETCCHHRETVTERAALEQRLSSAFKRTATPAQHCHATKTYYEKILEYDGGRPLCDDTRGHHTDDRRHSSRTPRM